MSPEIEKYNNKKWYDHSEGKVRKKRNPKKSVPLIILAILVLSAMIFFFVMSLFKMSDSYKNALLIARENTAVIERLGEPIEPGLIVMGTINVNGGSGYANYSFWISGPKGEGELYVEAVKQYGNWNFIDLAVVIEGEEPIKLTKKPIESE